MVLDENLAGGATKSTGIPGYISPGGAAIINSTDAEVVWQTVISPGYRATAVIVRRYQNVMSNYNMSLVYGSNSDTVINTPADSDWVEQTVVLANPVTGTATLTVGGGLNGTWNMLYIDAFELVIEEA